MAYQTYYQLKLLLNIECDISSDNPVRLLSAFMERMEFSALIGSFVSCRKSGPRFRLSGLFPEGTDFLREQRADFRDGPSVGRNLDLCGTLVAGEAFLHELCDVGNVHVTV